MNIFIKVKSKYYSIQLEDVLYFESFETGCKIVTKESSYLTSKNLGEYERILPTNLFKRINHGISINLQAIRSVDLSNNQVILSNDISLDVSFRKKKGLIETLKKEYFSL